MPDITIRYKDGLYEAKDADGVLVVSDADAFTAIMSALEPLKSTANHQTSPGTLLNRHVVLEGSGRFDTGWPLTQALTLPPMQNSVFDARTVTFTGGNAITIDSIMDTMVQLGVIGGPLLLHPRTAGPDNGIWIIDSQVEVSSLVGAGTGTGLLFNCTSGQISRSRFKAVNIHDFEKLIYAPNPGPGHAFMHNTIDVRALYNGTIGLRDGDPGNGGNLYNQWNISVIGTVATPIETYADISKSIYVILR